MITNSGADAPPTRLAAIPVRISWRFIAAAWATIAGAATVSLYASSIVGHTHSFSWLLAIVRQGIAWGFWAVLTPAILRLARRFPIVGPRWWRTLGLHALIGLLLTSAFNAIWILEVFAMGWFRTESVVPFLQQAVLRTVFELFVYLAVLALGSAADKAQLVREQDRRAAHSESHLLTAKLAALRAQLQPHFLFNALHTVALLIRERENDEALRVVLNLGELLHRVLDDADTEQIPVRRELAFLEQYVDIERVRFDESLAVTIDATADVLDAAVPPLLLQPLVENALRHGVATDGTHGAVRVSATRDGRDTVTINVVDTGAGMRGATRSAGGRHRIAQYSGAPGQPLPRNASAGDYGTRRTGYAGPSGSAVPSAPRGGVMGPPWRTCIADDERIARRGLKRLIESDRDIVVTAECRDGRELVTYLSADSPDLLFLDIQMPFVSGLDCLAALSREPYPVIVIVSAYPQHAIGAFEAQAIDYLVKPFADARLFRAVTRAKQQLALRQHERHQPAQRIAVRTERGLRLIAVNDIDWIEADDNAARVHVRGESVHIREPLSSLEGHLDAKQFVRVHRSAIVNIARVIEVQPYFHGRHVLLLSSGGHVVLARSRRGQFERVLGRPL